MPVKILDNTIVVECATFVTGPYATALLADLGARVIKIESPPEGDPYRYFASDPVFSFNFAHLNRNKESLVLDLKSSKGKEICFELLKRAHVLRGKFSSRNGGPTGTGLQHSASFESEISLLLDLGVWRERTVCGEARLRYSGTSDERTAELAQRLARSKGDGHGGVGLHYRTFRRLRHSRRVAGASEFRRWLPG